MLMDSIVPVEESLAECPGILDRPKSLRKSRGIFQGFELRFRIRVVVADMRLGMGFGHAKISQQVGYLF